MIPSISSTKQTHHQEYVVYMLKEIGKRARTTFFLLESTETFVRLRVKQLRRKRANFPIYSFICSMSGRIKPSHISTVDKGIKPKMSWLRAHDKVFFYVVLFSVVFISCSIPTKT